MVFADHPQYAVEFGAPSFPPPPSRSTRNTSPGKTPLLSKDNLTLDRSSEDDDWIPSRDKRQKGGRREATGRTKRTTSKTADKPRNNIANIHAEHPTEEY